MISDINVMAYVISYVTYWLFCFFPSLHAFFSYAGNVNWVYDPQECAASDSESDWTMDSREARDFADQNPDLNDPDSPGSTNDLNLAILAALFKSIPEFIEA